MLQDLNENAAEQLGLLAVPCLQRKKSAGFLPEEPLRSPELFPFPLIVG